MLATTNISPHIWTKILLKICTLLRASFGYDLDTKKYHKQANMYTIAVNDH